MRGPQHAARRSRLTLSRAFRALLRFTGIWALPWTALGFGVGLLRWSLSPDLRSTAGSLVSWLVNHTAAYGALGLLSGLYLGLLLAWLEHGRRWESVPGRRVGLWAGLAGAAPPALFAALGLVAGAAAPVYLPLLGLGVASAVCSSLLATSAHARARRQALAPGDPPQRLP